MDCFILLFLNPVGNIFFGHRVYVHNCTNLLNLKLFIYNNSRVNLLAYSPLAMGILSGKYFSYDQGPADARLNLFRGYTIYLLKECCKNFSIGELLSKDQFFPLSRKVQ